MTTPTYYFVNGKDLSDIFYPLTSGGTEGVNNTGYLYNAGTTNNPDYKDLIKLFAVYQTNSIPASITNYKSSNNNGKDLSEVFQNIEYPPNVFTVTGGGTTSTVNNYTVVTFNSSGTITFTQPTVSLSLIHISEPTRPY